MPELPEVETIVSSLSPGVVGRRIVEARVFLPKLVREPSVPEFCALLAGREVRALRRRGKYILFHLDGEYVLVIHLRMTGQLVLAPAGSPPGRHTRAVFHLEGGLELQYHDLRQFGTFHLLPCSSLASFAPLARLGPDALAPELTPALLERRLKGRRGGIKKVLLDQSFIAGVGNIYADEILWHAFIHPERAASSLTPGEVERLAAALREVLEEAVRERGTTLRDYVDGNGRPGGYQRLLRVHGREGEPCPRCAVPIARTRTAGRSSYFCPRCQH